MLYRSLATLIVVFWLTMTGLLLRREFGPNDTALREVPLAHVLKMMLAREQASDLDVYSEKTVVGHLRLQPHTAKETGQRKFSCSGWLQVAVPGMTRQRVVWTGDFDLGEKLELQRCTALLSLHEPAGYTVELTADIANQRIAYESRSGAVRIKRRDYALDEAGLRTWLRDEGIDPALLDSVRPAEGQGLEVTARQASLELRGEKVETYLITGEHSDQTLFEAHISQLGQILRVRTMLGYSAAPEDLLP